MNKVLFIDDEKFILNTIRRKLDSTEIDGYYASSAEQGLRIMEEEEISVVFTDLMMPKVNGLKVVEEIHRRRPETVVVVLSGNAQPSAILKTMNTKHVFRYLSKPWRLDEKAIHFIKVCIDEAKNRSEGSVYESQVMIPVNEIRRFSNYRRWIVVDTEDHVVAASDDYSVSQKEELMAGYNTPIMTNKGYMRVFGVCTPWY